MRLSAPQQIVFNSNKRFRVLVTGRRFGKTALDIAEIAKFAKFRAKKPRLIWYVAPYYGQAKEIAWSVLKERLLESKWVDGRRALNESSLTATLTNGNVIKLKGADNPDCYDDETEVLTINGWVKFGGLQEGVSVMTLNPKTQCAEWHLPYRYIHQYYEGKMKQVQSKKIDLLVTPNHRFFVKSSKGVCKFKALGELSYKDRIPASANWIGETCECISDDMVAFMGFYIAEGCARKNPGDKCSYEIVFAQTPGKKGGLKGDVRNEFIAVLKRMGIKYCEYPTVIKVNNKELWQKVVGLGIAPEKRIPRQYLNLPPQQLKIMLDWLIKGDGIIREGEEVYYTTSYGLAGDIQELCLKIGRTANIQHKKQQACLLLKSGRTIKSKHNLYAVSIYRNKYNYFRRTNENYISDIENFKGIVHCVEVKNNIIMVRRNGKMCWSGNSLRGSGVNFMVLDEFQDIKEKAWTEVLRPMLSDTKGHALFSGTPKGFSHAYRLFQRGQKGTTEYNPEWESWRFTTLEGGNVSQYEIDEARKDLDEKTFRQEYEASFESYAGIVYYSFDHVQSLMAYNKPVQQEFNKTPLHVGMDFNINPMCATIAIENKLYSHLIDEIVIYSSNTDEMAEELRTRYPYNPIFVYPDPACKQRRTSAGSNTDLNILQHSRYNFNVRVRTSHSLIRDRTNSVNSRFKSASGDRRMFISPKCKTLIKCLTNQLYKPGTMIPDKDTGFDHMNDALGYYVDYLYPVSGDYSGTCFDPRG